jgi:SAM-dependent methyltransferase
MAFMVPFIVVSELPLPPEEIRLVGRGDFEKVGELVFRQVAEFGGLKPYHTVLDGGCGVGRVARPLTGYLTGEYEGFDVQPLAIEWCQKNITPRYPNFRFALADVENGRYNPGGTHLASEYRFPYEDGSFDFAFFASVFTHMLPADMENYVREAARVLKKGGRLFATYFLINEESEALMPKGHGRLDFSKRIEQGCRTARPGCPEKAVAYAEGRIRRLWTRNGLMLISIRFGTWCRPEADYHQDVLVAVKA